MTRVANPLIPVETPEMSRHLLSRARASGPPPRLGRERDKGPRLLLSKRKRELFLSEHKRTKRKKYEASPRGRVSRVRDTLRPIVMSGKQVSTKMGRQLRGSGCLLPSLMTRVRFLGPTWWKGKTIFDTLFSDHHTGTHSGMLVHVCVHNVKNS